MRRQYISLCLVLSFVIIQVTSQVIWLNPDTGEVLGVSPSGSKQPPQFPQQQQQPHQQQQQQQPGNYGYPHRGGHPHRGNPNWGRPNNQQNSGQSVNNVNAEWVCRNTRTGDQVILYY